MTFEFIQRTLAERETEGLLRSRKLVSEIADGLICIDGKRCLNFGSNDYLGLSQHPDVLQSYVEGLAQYGAGSTASAAVCGYMRPHKTLEDKLCEMFNKQAVLLFNSGFAANQSICQALFPAQSREENHILCDKHMHASFIEGAMHANANFKRFKHNDLLHFATKLRTCSGNTLVATEGVFSMDGDIGEISDIQAMLKAHDYPLLVDDAHGFGVLGKTGLGVSETADIDARRIDILLATFGKAIGTAGAFIAGSEDFIEYLVNFAKHYIYTTAMPPAQAVATLTAIKIMQTSDQRTKLHENISLFQQLCNTHALPVLPSDSAIQPLIIGDAHRCVLASQSLLSLGVFTPAIRTPTVSKGTDRLRITLSALHHQHDIQALIDALCVVRERQGWPQ